MSATQAPVARPTARRGRVVARRWLRRHWWPLGVWVLLFALVGWYATLIPEFGEFQVASILRNSLPAVYMALAQGVVVIAGGVDLGVGALMVLANSVSASLMEDRGVAATSMIAIGVVLGAAAINAVVGWIIATSRIPDVVVTLGTLFIFAGAALLVLPSPGGGTSGGLRYVFTGSEVGVGTNYWPPLVMLVVPTALLAVWLNRTRAGLALYALGSSENAAYLSGVRIKGAKVLSYAVGGGFAGLAGVAMTTLANSGDPRFVNALNGLLNSLAAVVLGGIVLGGGSGSVIGAAAAGIILFTLNPVLTAMGVDPNTAQIVRGVLIVVLMMGAGLLQWRRWRAE